MAIDNEWAHGMRALTAEAAAGAARFVGGAGRHGDGAGGTGAGG
jgi:enoyl-CoA hydratase